MEDRTVYIDKLAAQLKEWDSKIQNLETKVDQAKSDAKGEYKNQIDELKTKKESISQNLQQIRDAGGDTWMQLKQGADETWKQLQSSLDRIADNLR